MLSWLLANERLGSSSASPCRLCMWSCGKACGLLQTLLFYLSSYLSSYLPSYLSSYLSNVRLRGHQQRCPLHPAVGQPMPLSPAWVCQRLPSALAASVARCVLLYMQAFLPVQCTAGCLWLAALCAPLRPRAWSGLLLCIFGGGWQRANPDAASPAFLLTRLAH